MQFINSIDYARDQDEQDALRKFRERFYFPENKDKPLIYFTGNSLGLQPKSVADYIKQELDDWATFGVDGHFKAKNPWYSYHEMFSQPLAGLMGAQPTEVVAMGSLTANLHTLMVSFYRPTKDKFKILCENKPFPSDRYAFESQANFHGFNADETIIELKPRDGELTLRTEDILQQIEENKNELCLVLFGGVNYYTGQAFDMKSITSAAHNAGSIVGFDLAHAAGNLNLSLHEWNVDFAAWCSYKYLNSGPGSVAGIFVHEKHGNEKDLPRFAGWWGHDKKLRFKMDRNFIPMEGAEGWQLSNAPVLSMAAHKASLDIFMEAGMKSIGYKRDKLTAYLQFIIEELNEKHDAGIKIITPLNKEERGCQLSLIVKQGKQLFNKISAEGIVADWREPDVMRLAPVPLYNSFEDVFLFGEVLKEVINEN
jgi:kynureninase